MADDTSVGQQIQKAGDGVSKILDRIATPLSFFALSSIGLLFGLGLSLGLSELEGAMDLWIVGGFGGLWLINLAVVGYLTVKSPKELKDVGRQVNDLTEFVESDQLEIFIKTVVIDYLEEGVKPARQLEATD